MGTLIIEVVTWQRAPEILTIKYFTTYCNFTTKGIVKCMIEKYTETLKTVFLRKSPCFEVFEQQEF